MVLATKSEAETKEPGTALSWPKKFLFVAISLVFVVLAMCVMGEVLLRILPLGSYRSAPFRQYDPKVGLALVPNVKVAHHRGCFAGEVDTNQWGMRDRDRSLGKNPGVFRVALLGDSAVEGVQVKPDEVINIQMEKLLAEKGYKNAEVMNFAVEGIGTTQELVMYKEKVRQFHPDLVVVMFAWNDVMNNSSTLQPASYGIHTWYAPYYDLKPDGTLAFQPVKPLAFGSTRTFLERHSVLVYYLERVWLTFDWSPRKWEGLPIYFGTYGEKLDSDWSRAWLVTEKVMSLMRDTVTQDGSKFMVVAWPDFADIDPNWRERLSKQVGPLPPDFDAYKPEERLKDLAQRNDIALGFLAPYMQAYRDQKGLQWPYFSHTCDQHWTALGHRIGAQAMVKELEQRQLLSTADRESKTAKAVPFNH